MLILSRYPRQVIAIGHDIQVMVLDIAGQRVRLGITAPKEIRVQRQEVHPFSAAPAPQ